MIFEIGKSESGKTIEEYLRQKAFTRKEISRMKFAEYGICLNGRKSRVNVRIKEGDLLEIELLQEKKKSCEWVPVPLQAEVLYEDDYLIALDKPAGVVVHPSGGHYMDTLANQLAGYYEEKGLSCAVRPIGRLDKDVSGVVLFAKDQVTASRLASERKQGLFTKEYLALTEGVIEEEEQTIQKRIQVLPSKYSSEVSENGKPAETTVNVIKRIWDAEDSENEEDQSGDRKKGRTLVKCTIRHGRMHQIRVHLASIGHPILGDRLYGSRENFGERIALHAYSAAFLHPFSNRVIKIESNQNIFI